MSAAMTATPTPGDNVRDTNMTSVTSNLSARLLALAEVLPPRVAHRDIDRPDANAAFSFVMSPLHIEQLHIRFDQLTAAIAALSALPAAGEPVAWLVEKTGKSSWSGKVETRRDAILGSPESYREEGFTCRPLVFGDTTPQPSAAEELGPHPLNTCPKCKDYYMECECPADPAVGAQGDGEAARGEEK